MKVAIFPGHVGKDAGVVDKYDGKEDKLYTIEAAVNNAISAYLHGFLSQINIDSDVYYGTFKDRIHKSLKCDLGISIHCDWIGKDKIKGYHAMHYPGSSLGRDFAKMIVSSMNDYTDINMARKIHTRKDLYILNRTMFPTVLFEAGFVSNIDQERLLNESWYQKNIAFALAAAIKKMSYKL